MVAVQEEQLPDWEAEKRAALASQQDFTGRSAAAPASGTQVSRSQRLTCCGSVDSWAAALHCQEL